MGAQKETFYSAPPFDYQPSVAEYLSTLRVTKNGVIADIMRMDERRNVEILDYYEDGLRLRLRSREGLEGAKIFLYSYLEKCAGKVDVPGMGAYLRNIGLGQQVSQDTGIAEVRFGALSRFSPKYQEKVLSEAGKLAGSAPKPALGAFDPTKRPWGYIELGFLISFALGVVENFFLFPLLILSAFASSVTGSLVPMIILSAISLAFPFAVVYMISRRKLAKHPLERKYLFGTIMGELIVLYCLLLLFNVAFLLLSAPSQGQRAATPGTQFAGGLFCLGAAAFILLTLYYYHVLGRTAYLFLRWLSEPEGVSEQRQKWLAFKDFIITHSEVEKRPLKYYEMWGAFYYYALAVGAMEGREKIG